MSDNQPPAEDPYATPSGDAAAGGAPSPGSAPSSSSVPPYGGYEPPAAPQGGPAYPEQPAYGQQPYGASQQPYGQGYGQQPPVYGAPQEPYGQPYPAQAYPTYGQPRDTSGNALGVWSLVLAIVTLFTCCLPASVVGIVLGVKARRAVREGRADNGSLATVGYVLNIVLTVLVVLFIVGVLVLVSSAGSWEQFLEEWSRAYELEVDRSAV